MSQRKRPRFLAEILGASFVFLVGALIFRSTFEPIPDKEPEMAADMLPQVPNSNEGWVTPKPAQLKAARSSIQGQIDAFGRDDYVLATRYQASNLKNNFGSAEVFRSMMRQQYPQFAAPGKLTFGQATATRDGKHVQVSIQLVGKDGVHVSAVYSLVLEDGLYRVEAVAGGQPQGNPPPPPAPGSGGRNTPHPPGSRMPGTPRPPQRGTVPAAPALPSQVRNT